MIVSHREVKSTVRGTHRALTRTAYRALQVEMTAMGISTSVEVFNEIMEQVIYIHHSAHMSCCFGEGVACIP